MGEYETIPTYVTVQRHYRIYTKVKKGACIAEVDAAVMKYISTNGLYDSDLDLELPEIEEADVICIRPDWDGAWTTDEGGIE